MVVGTQLTSAQTSYEDDAASTGTDDSDYAGFLALVNGSPEKDAQQVATKTAPQPSWDENSTDDSDYKNFMAMTRAPSNQKAGAEVPKVIESRNTDATWEASSTDDRAATAKPTSKISTPVPMARGATKETVADSESSEEELESLPPAESSSAANKPAELVVQSSWKSAATNVAAKDAAVVPATTEPPAVETSGRSSIAARPKNKFREESKVMFDDTPAPPAGAEVESAEAEETSKSWKALEAKAAIKAKRTEKFELPEDAVVASKYFDREEDKKKEEIEAAKLLVKQKPAVEPLPVDYFTKLGEKQMEEKAKAQWAAAEAVMPAGVAYFTAKAEEDKKKALEEFAKGHSEMSVATKYFNKLDADKKAEAARKAKEEPEPMPAAIQHFSMEAHEKYLKSQREIKAMHDNPPEMPEATAYFTNMENERREKQQAENRALKENPPPSSTATAYFAVKENQRKLEIENMANEPAPAAVEYFTSKAAEEKRVADEAMKRSDARAGEKSAAVEYFEKQASLRIQKAESNRALINAKPYEEPLPVDYFTKLGDKEREEKAKAQWEAAEAVMPAGVAYFTAKAKEDREKALAEHAKGHSEMSVATKYFNKLDADKKAEAARKAKEEPEPMPAAIQKFTMEAYKEHEKKKAEIKAMHDNPPDMPEATAYFTNMENERREKQQAENRALKENPPPSSTATAYFAVKESQRKLEIENMANEPAPAAVEYFTNKANEEKAKADEAMKRAEANGHEKAEATAHFDKKAEEKKQAIQEARERTREKMKQPGSRKSIDWASYSQQKAPDVNLFYTVAPDDSVEQ